MINRDMRYYDYLTYSGSGSYGQPKLTEDVKGSVKMAIYHYNTSTQDNIKYRDCTYTALTRDNSINDSFVIKYGGLKLKVMYITPAGKYKQVYLKEI